MRASAELLPASLRSTNPPQAAVSEGAHRSRASPASDRSRKRGSRGLAQRRIGLLQQCHRHEHRRAVLDDIEARPLQCAAPSRGATGSELVPPAPIDAVGRHRRKAGIVVAEAAQQMRNATESRFTCVERGQRASRRCGRTVRKGRFSDVATIGTEGSKDLSRGVQVVPNRRPDPLRRSWQKEQRFAVVGKHSGDLSARQFSLGDVLQDIGAQD